jgi:putative solute:sodium symporter small subunit
LQARLPSTRADFPAALAALATLATLGCAAPGQPYTMKSTPPLTDRHLSYWQKNLRLTAVLMAIWFVVTFGIAFFARDLSFNFLGWPFSFWVASQGALIVYFLIIWFYARTMNRLDREHGVAEED